MSDIYDKVEEEFEKYVISKVGKTKIPPMPSFQESWSAIEELAPKYDRGIGIARDGLWLSFISNLYDLPASIVRMGRKGKGARWNPIDELKEDEFKGKKIIVFDNDVVTGRTLIRLTKEIKKFEPSCLDLLLHFNYTFMNSKSYFRWQKYFKPECKCSISSDGGLYCVETTPQVPKEIGKIYTLGSFYKTDKEIIKRFEEKFKEKYGK